jgi:hypothetical protein
MEDKLLILRFKRGSTDVVHDVFVQLAQSPQKVRLRGNLRSLLATCVVNRLPSYGDLGCPQPSGALFCALVRFDFVAPHRGEIYEEHSRETTSATARHKYDRFGPEG